MIVIILISARELLDVTSPKYKVRSKTMISCVTYDVYLVVKPAIDEHVDRIHLVRFNQKPKDEKQLQRYELLEKIFKIVCEKLDDAHIEYFVHDQDEVYSYNKMLKTVYGILEDEKECSLQVLVNIAGGPPEYAAAAACASMMFDNAKPFSVAIPAKERIKDFYQYEEFLTDNTGELVGIGKVTTPLNFVEKLKQEPPNMVLLRALKVFEGLPLNKRGNKDVARHLVENGLWSHSSNPNDFFSGTSFELLNAAEDSGIAPSEKRELKYKASKMWNSEAVMYQREYIDKWKKEGWIEKDPMFGKKYVLTERGKSFIETFCPDL